MPQESRAASSPPGPPVAARSTVLPIPCRCSPSPRSWPPASVTSAPDDCNGRAGRLAEVVVVGAGVGGLAAAARLARAGHRVTVCEQADRVGGKLGLLERDGFRFDTGPSLLTMPHVFKD